MTITLPPEIEGALSEQAKIQGTTPESLAVETLRKALLTSGEPRTPAADRSLYDRLAPYIGAVQGTGESFSENCGERFTDYLLEKKQRGHL
jgi:hypothetical protein